MDFSVYRGEMLEAWDWIEGVPCGVPVSREKSYLEGVPHEGVHLWLGRMRKGIKEILFQKRALHKTLFPGVLDITVGGHVPFGLKNGKIQKEAQEELGISPQDNELTDLGYIRFEEKNSQYWHREFQHVYIMESDIELNEYRFSDGEVTGIYAVPLDYLRKILLEDFTFEASRFENGVCEDVRISGRDFHPLLFAENMKVYMGIVIESMSELLGEGKVFTKMKNLTPPVL